MKKYDELYISGAWLAPMGRIREACLFGIEEFLEVKSLQLRMPGGAS